MALLGARGRWSPWVHSEPPYPNRVQGSQLDGLRPGQSPSESRGPPGGRKGVSGPHTQVEAQTSTRPSMDPVEGVATGVRLGFESSQFIG